MNRTQARTRKVTTDLSNVSSGDICWPSFFCTMFTLSWRKPSSKEQNACLAGSQSGEFNYDSQHVGASSGAPFTDGYESALKKDGYHINHARVKLGRGSDAFLRARENLQRWRHFQLGWASVDASTPIKVGSRFCVCSQELCTWILNPLEVLYVEDSFSRESKGPAGTGAKPATAFSFGSGTLKGHLLAGEERFAVEWDVEDDQVYFDIYSFSKPANMLATVAYPIVKFKQALFSKHSTEAMRKAMHIHEPEL